MGSNIEYKFDLAKEVLLKESETLAIKQVTGKCVVTRGKVCIENVTNTFK